MAPPSGDQVSPVIVLVDGREPRSCLPSAREQQAACGLGDREHVALRAPGDDVDRPPRRARRPPGARRRRAGGCAPRRPRPRSPGAPGVGCQAMRVIGPSWTLRRTARCRRWRVALRRRRAAVPTRQLAAPARPGDRARVLADVERASPGPCAVGRVAPTTAAHTRARWGAAARAVVRRRGGCRGRARDRSPWRPMFSSCSRRQVAVAGAADARGAVDRPQPALHLGDLAGRDHVGLVDDQHVGERDLLVSAGLPRDVQRQQPRVDQRRQAVEPEAALDLLVHQERAHDRAGVGGPGRLDQDAIVLLAPARDADQRADQIDAHRAAHEAVVHLEDLFVGRDDRRALDGHLAELVLDDEDALAALRDDAVDQRRLPRAQGPGENGDGDLGRHEGSHDLARAAPFCAIRYTRPIADAVVVSMVGEPARDQCDHGYRRRGRARHRRRRDGDVDVSGDRRHGLRRVCSSRTESFVCAPTSGRTRVRAWRWRPAAAMTFALLLSSLTMTLATRAPSVRARRGWLVATLALGVAFLAGAAIEYAHLLAAASPMGLSSDLFASTFYVVTGFHALHVVAGLIGVGLHVTREVSTRKLLKPWRYTGTSWMSPGCRSSRSSICGRRDDGRGGSRGGAARQPRPRGDVRRADRPHRRSS